MNIKDLIDLDGISSISGIFSIIGSFGIFDEKTQYKCFHEGCSIVYRHISNTVELSANYTSCANGVIVRQD